MTSKLSTIFGCVSSLLLLLCGNVTADIPPPAASFVSDLGLTRTHFGTYFLETYQSDLTVSDLPDRFQGASRALSSSIYNLYARDNNAGKDQASFPIHRLASDEAWYWFDGDGPIELYLFDFSTGHIQQVSVGVCPGSVPQFTVPYSTWIGALLANRTTWALTGSSNTPAFDPRDSEMAAGNSTLEEVFYSRFPQHRDLISRLLF